MFPCTTHTQPTSVLPKPPHLFIYITILPHTHTHIYTTPNNHVPPLHTPMTPHTHTHTHTHKPVILHTYIMMLPHNHKHTYSAILPHTHTNTHIHTHTHPYIHIHTHPCIYSTMPSILEVFSYLFNFQGILVGPKSFFIDYKHFVEGTGIHQYQRNASVTHTSIIPLSDTSTIGHRRDHAI